MQYCKSRIDFFITINSTFNEVEIRTDYHQKIQAASNFLSDKEIKIIRIGYVATFEADLSSLKITAPRYIKQHFIADKKFKDPQELTVRYVHRVTYNSGIDTNIVASMNQKGSGLTLELNKLLIQFDINSIPERTQNLTAQQINEFSAQALSEIASLIQNFPAI